MRPFTHRDPGIVGAALTRDDVAVGVIADPSHLSPEAIRLAFRAARGRVVLVTDDLAAGGCPDGDLPDGLGRVHGDRRCRPCGFLPDRGIGLLRPGDRADVLVLDGSPGVRDVLHEADPSAPDPPPRRMLADEDGQGETMPTSGNREQPRRTGAARTSRALIAIKVVHTLVWLSVESCVAYLLYAGFAKRSDRRAAIMRRRGRHRMRGLHRQRAALPPDRRRRVTRRRPRLGHRHLPAALARQEPRRPSTSRW